jgi:hypothetical protein
MGMVYIWNLLILQVVNLISRIPGIICIDIFGAAIDVIWIEAIFILKPIPLNLDLIQL